MPMPMPIGGCIPGGGGRIRKVSQYPPGQSSLLIISTPLPKSLGYSGLLDVTGGLESPVDVPLAAGGGGAA